MKPVLSKINLNTIIQGDCIEEMKKLPEGFAKVIFADPPYNMQLNGELYRPNQTRVDGVDDEWDKFHSFQEYDDFTKDWLTQCRRLLSDDGTIWVIGSYHNIFRVGKIMQDLGYWILNDIIWVKTNPMPNFNGVRFTNAHETLIWAKKSEKQKKYTFNYRAMKNLNDEKQMRSDWEIPICSGNERCKENGSKAHSTQKPEGLLRRIILASSNPGDVIFDPFFGSGTTGAAAKKLKRNWLGIEKQPKYIDIATERINALSACELSDDELITPSKRELPKVSVSGLLEVGLLQEGQKLFSKDKKYSAVLCADGFLKSGELRGSIHKLGAVLQNKPSCNGWDFWYIKQNDALVSIDLLRDKYRKQYL